MSEVKPYGNLNAGKKEQVSSMFNKIAKTYDFLNHFLSLGIDIYWRKTAIKMLKNKPHEVILDVATGTGDFAFEAIGILKPQEVIGVDIAEDMLKIAQQKIEKRGLADIYSVQYGDSECLSFEEGRFDAVTVSFGVRNFEDLEAGLNNIHRVLKIGGTALVLEFSKPTVFPVKQLYSFYFKQILPLLGKIFSKDQSAYTYLPDSVYAFPDGKKIVGIMNKVGFKDASFRALTFGLCTVYIGTKC